MLRKRILLVLTLCLAALAVSLAHAQGVCGLTWWIVGVGGGTSSGGDYTLRGIAGQPDAGAMSGGVYTLDGGFWGGAPVDAKDYFLYVPLVMRGN